MQNELYLSIHSMNWRICCDQEMVLEKLKMDFYLYVVQSPQCDQFDQTLFIKHQLCEAKRKGDISFAGHVTVRRDYKKNVASVYCGSNDRLHEISYLYILSLLGKFLDRRGFHRIHASAVGVGDKAYLFVGASGMGKSHLSYLLPNETLADDMLFINKHGKCLPMLHRRGFNKSKSSSIVLNNSYSMKRREYGEKILGPIKKKASQDLYSLDTFCFLKAGKKMKLESASMIIKFKFLFLYLFIGFGTPQMLKFFWEPGFKDFTVKLQITYSRFITMLYLLWGSKSLILSTTKSADSVDFVQCQLFMPNEHSPAWSKSPQEGPKPL